MFFSPSIDSIRLKYPRVRDMQTRGFEYAHCAKQRGKKIIAHEMQKTTSSGHLAKRSEKYFAQRDRNRAFWWTEGCGGQKLLPRDVYLSYDAFSSWNESVVMMWHKNRLKITIAHCFEATWTERRAKCKALTLDSNARSLQSNTCVVDFVLFSNFFFYHECGTLKHLFSTSNVLELKNGNFDGTYFVRIEIQRLKTLMTLHSAARLVLNGWCISAIISW